jgi:hypothetical protein
MSERTYYQVQPISRTEAKNAFKSGDVERITHALLGLAHYEDDLKWVQDLCVQYLANENPSLRATAATCLAHLTRIHGKLDKRRVMPLLKSLRDDPEISGFIDDAIGDINHFLKPQEQ